MKTKLILAGLGLFAMFNMQAQRPVQTGAFNNQHQTDYFDEPIAFEERDIMFYVFLDGTFDFNTEPTTYVDYVSRRGNTHYDEPRGIRIERDAQGKIRRIGNVFISYAYDYQVKRIGSVFIEYNRGRMERIGNLKIMYTRYGVQFAGNVKGGYYNNNHYYTNNWNSFSYPNGYTVWEYGYYDPFFHSQEFYNNYESVNEDSDFYYFKSKDKGTKEGNIIKQKKAENSRNNETRRKVS